MKKYTVGKTVIAVFLFFGLIGWTISGFAYSTNNSTNVNDVSPTTSSQANGNVDNSKTTNTNTAFGGVSNSNSSVKDSGNSSSSSKVDNSGNSSNRNSNTNKQAQGQAQGQKQSNSGTNTTNDNSGSGNKAYAVAYPSVTSQVGTSSGSGSSIFGSLSISTTEKYKQITDIIQAINAEVSGGVLTKDQGATIVAALNTKLFGTIKTQRVLGILWETDGKNLSNLLGLLSWGSVWKDGAAQGGDLNAIINAALDSAETNKDVTGDATPTPAAVPATGNGGNLPAGDQKS